MKIEHTEGPWKAHGVMVMDTQDTLGGMYRIVMPNGQFAFCTNRADARPIAAVPALIEALNNLLDYADRHQDDAGYQAAFEAGEAALRKATL